MFATYWYKLPLEAATEEVGTARATFSTGSGAAVRFEEPAVAVALGP